MSARSRDPPPRARRGTGMRLHVDEPRHERTAMAVDLRKAQRCEAGRTSLT